MDRVGVEPTTSAAAPVIFLSISSFQGFFFLLSNGGKDMIS